MPYCGASVLHCDIPVRFDTSRGGCDFQCSYCSEMVHGRFNPRPFESWKSLESFIKGARNADTNWVNPDWRIPLHFGVLSDPLPRSDKQTRRSYKALYTFAEYGYPFILTTKSTLVVDAEYLGLLSQCNSVIQVSMISKSFSAKYEHNAPSYRERFAMLYRLARNVKRLVVRSQPFVVGYLDELIAMIPAYKSSGVYAILVGGISLRRPLGNINVRTGDGYVYRGEVLHEALETIRDCCHANDLEFLTCESESADLSDSLTCCGCEGLEGFAVNKCNLSYDFENYVNDTMKLEGTGQVFRSGTRDSRFKYSSYIDVIRRFYHDGNDGLVK